MAKNWKNSQEMSLLAFLPNFLTKFTMVKKSFSIYHIKFGLAYFFALFITGFWTPFFLFRPRDVRNLKYTRYMTELLSWALGVHYQTRNLDYIQNKPAVVICNHQSTLDVLGLIHLSNRLDAFTVVVKKALLYIWPFGPCVWLGGAIFVDRKQPALSYRALDGAKDWLKKNQACKFWFFPEGTRNQEANRTRTLLPFKKGAFRIAIACQIPIIPVVNSPYYFVNKSRLFFSEGTVITEVLAPIATTGLTEADTEDLMARVQKMMQEKYEELFNEIESTLPKSYVGLS